MIGFASIAGGSPSSVSAMTDHLLNKTVVGERARLAAYYTRGLAPLEDADLVAYAYRTEAGAMSFEDAVDGMMAGYLRRGGDLDRIDAVQDGMITRLADAIERIERGEPATPAPPLAIVRPDIHPLAAAALGLDTLTSDLTTDHINGLLSGRRADGKKIAGKTYARERDYGPDAKTGERKISTPIGSYDFCPTPDKSVSVAWAFAQPAEQAMIYNAHIAASRAAVGYIADELGWARFGKGGEGETVKGHVGWIEFTHATGRKTQMTMPGGIDASLPGDPDLHTHNLITNAVFCDDGRVGSLDTKRIRGFIFEADALYHAHLAQNLADAGFGVVMDPKTGAAKLGAIPDDVNRLFSKRTNLGEDLARQFTHSRGEIWDDLSAPQRAARVKAATQSRDQKVKGGKDDVANFADWRRQAKETAGWEPSSFLAYGPRAPTLSDEARIRMAYEATHTFVSNKLDRRSVISQWDVRAAAGKGLVHSGIKSVDDISAVTALMRSEGVTQYGERTPLIWAREDDGRVSITTGLHESHEREFVALAQSAAQDRSAIVPSASIDRAIRESGLDFSGSHGEAQLLAIKHLASGSGKFGVSIGAAGAGKTTMLKPLVAAWKEGGREIYAASLAWRQADDLTEAGIKKENVKAFSVLIDAAKQDTLKLDRNAVVAVDEFGLLGTRQALELLRLRAKHGFSIVALGDDKQCTAIEAGAIIDLGRRALGPEQVPTIITTIRQQTEREREIAGHFRAGRAKQALDMKRADKTAEMVKGGYNGTIDRAAKLYVSILQETGRAPTVSVPTNRGAHNVSVAIREQRRALGLVGPDRKHLSVVDPDGRAMSLPLAVGDRVRVFLSTGAKFENGRGGTIGRNGSVLDILAIDAGGMRVRNVKRGTEGRVAWAALADKSGRTRLAYGDAMTIHTAQGVSTDAHVSVLPSGSKEVNGFSAYSMDTRHRLRSHLLINEGAEISEIVNRRPLNDKSAITIDDMYGNVGRNFASQPTKDLALSMLDRVQGLRRGSVQQFARGLHAAEDRKRRGQAPSHVHEAVERRRIALSHVVEHARAIGRELHSRVREGIETTRQIMHTRERRRDRGGPSLDL